ncbi:MAG: STAS domain-containing protein [Phycisphaerae bacterium]
MHSPFQRARQQSKPSVQSRLPDGRHVSELTRADTPIFDDPSPPAGPGPGSRPPATLRLTNASADDSVDGSVDDSVDVGPMSASPPSQPLVEETLNVESSILSQAMMTVEPVGEMSVVHIQCPAVRERQAAALADQLYLVAERSRGKVMLDLTKVAAFSCAWINVLLEVSKRCRSRGGGLVLTGLCTPAAHTLRQMGLERQFTIAA